MLRDLVAKFVLAFAILAGASYTVHLVNEVIAAPDGAADVVTTATIAWKGSGVWLLAVYAALRAWDWRGWSLVLVMGVGALGDVLVERDLVFGAGAFAIGHIVAIFLYLSMRRHRLSESQKWLAIVTVPAVMTTSWFLTGDSFVVVYAALLAMMASAAWISRFPRYVVGIGVMIFLASDVLIFAQLGPLEEAIWPRFLIWVLYFAGQVLIAKGVCDTLSKERGQDSNR